MLVTARCAGLLLPLALIGIPGCYQQSASNAGTAGPASPVVAEGVIFSVEWVMGDGKTTAGFTRLNIPMITYPQQKDLGPRVIRADRLVEIRFGDGGIKRVSETASRE